MTTIIDAMTDAEIGFGRWFEGESWGAWRVILKAVNDHRNGTPDLRRIGTPVAAITTAICAQRTAGVDGLC
jgi:hypothetical protein